MTGHIPVLFDEVLEQAGEAASDLGRDLAFGFDATFGRGGHTRGLLEAHPTMTMVAFDQDDAAIRFGRQNFAAQVEAGKLKLVHANFEKIQQASESAPGGFDFMLFDLGVSSPQLDEADRGFSFYHDGPLDMRMDHRIAKTAADLVNTASEAQLEQIFKEWGEVDRPFKVIRAIVQDRKATPFTSTKQLAGLIERVDGWAKKGFHPATQYFMALRLEVNREIEVVETALPEALQMLAPGGRLAVITFHSLEDRLVKNLFRTKEDEEFGENVRRKATQPSDEEVKRNARSRSAKLRVFRRYKTGEGRAPKNKYAHLIGRRNEGDDE